MRKNPTYDIEAFRVTEGPMRSTKALGANGAFLLHVPGGQVLKVICSDGTGSKECGLPPPVWEHVSVSCEHRCPTWAEMDYVKRIFWRDDELVLQFHVPRVQHININQFVLHLWKPVGVKIPPPPPQCV